MPYVWPTSGEVHDLVRRRLEGLLAEQPGVVADVGQRTLSAGSGILSDHPHSLISVMVPGACLAAGADWRAALWPAVGAECMMAAADLFDDVADADADTDTGDQTAPLTNAVLLTAAAGLLGLAGSAVVRVVDDGASARTGVALARLFGEAFAQAANGQASNLQPTHDLDPLTAYRQAAAKSGPLGSLIARLGARTATDNRAIVDLFGEFGLRQAVRSQLLNDTRDAAPDAAHRKSDVRDGARTVPLVFVGSRGAPSGLSASELHAWEEDERARVASGGGLAATLALAEAERLAGLDTLDRLERLGCQVDTLRQLI